MDSTLWCDRDRHTSRTSSEIWRISYVRWRHSSTSWHVRTVNSSILAIVWRRKTTIFSVNSTTSKTTTALSPRTEDNFSRSSTTLSPNWKKKSGYLKFSANIFNYLWQTKWMLEQHNWLYSNCRYVLGWFLRALTTTTHAMHQLFHVIILCYTLWVYHA